MRRPRTSSSRNSRTIVVTATRLPMRSFDVPAMVSTTDAATVQGLLPVPHPARSARRTPRRDGAEDRPRPGFAVHPRLHRLPQRAADRRHPAQQLGVPRRSEPVLEHGRPVLLQSRGGAARPGLGALRQRRDRRGGERALGPRAAGRRGPLAAAAVPLLGRRELEHRPGRVRLERRNPCAPAAAYTYKDYGDLEGGRRGRHAAAAPATTSATPTCASSTTSPPTPRWSSATSTSTRTTPGARTARSTASAGRAPRSAPTASLRSTSSVSSVTCKLRHDGLGRRCRHAARERLLPPQSEDQYRMRSNLRSDELGFDVVHDRARTHSSTRSGARCSSSTAPTGTGDKVDS